MGLRREEMIGSVLAMLRLSSREPSNWQNPKGKSGRLKLHMKRFIYKEGEWCGGKEESPTQKF